MILIICAAGRGTRLKNYIKNKPKCLITLNKVTILENLLNIFQLKKINKILILVGFNKKMIIQKIGNHYKEKKIFYIYNKNYRITNNMYSLYLTKKYINEDIIFVSSDLFIDPKIKDKINKLKKKNFILVSKNKSSFEDNTITRVEIKDRFIKSLGKKEFSGKISAVAPGMCGMSESNFKKFLKISGNFIKQKRYQYGYNEVLRVLIKKKLRFFAFNPGNYLWRNINKKYDVKYIKNKLKV